MFLKLRVLCTVLSALCLAFALTAGAIWGTVWLLILGLGALMFFLLMHLFKQYQEKEEAKKEETQPSPSEPVQANHEEIKKED